MLWSILFSFGVNLLLASGLLLWYRVYGTFLFHAAIIAVLPTYLAQAIGASSSEGARCSVLSLSMVVTSALAATAVNSLLFRVAADRGLLRTAQAWWRPGRISSKTGVLLGSLALYTVGVSALRMAFTARPRLVACGMESTGYGVRGMSVLAAAIGIALFVCLVVALRRSAVGLALRAITTNLDAAESFGFRGRLQIHVAIFVGGLLMGMGGLVVGADSGVTPTSGFRWLLAAAAAMIIGGSDLESILRGGPLWGAALVAFLVAAGTWMLDATWADAVLFSVLVGVLMFRPEGLFVKTSRR